MSARRTVLLALLALAVPLWARGAELVVVEARGVGFQPGEIIDDSKTLSLSEGQHVTLISADGATLKLDGPYDKAPGSGGGGGDQGIGTALGALLTQTNARAEAGVVRAGAQPVVLPGPWLLPVSRPGTVCVRDGERPVVWRENAAKRSALTIIPGDRTWRAEAVWTAGSDRMLLPKSIPISGGTTYRMRLDGNESAVTVKLVPPVLTKPEMQAAWLADVGCEAQAEALAKSIR